MRITSKQGMEKVHECGSLWISLAKALTSRFAQQKAEYDDKVNKIKEEYEKKSEEEKHQCTWEEINQEKLKHIIDK